MLKRHSKEDNLVGFAVSAGKSAIEVYGQDMFALMRTSGRDVRCQAVGEATPLGLAAYPPVALLGDGEVTPGADGEGGTLN